MGACLRRAVRPRLAQVEVFRSVPYVLRVTRLHLKQPGDSASLVRFTALAIVVAAVQGREVLHFVRVCDRDNPFPTDDKDVWFR